MRRCRCVVNPGHLLSGAYAFETTRERARPNELDFDTACANPIPLTDASRSSALSLIQALAYFTTLDFFGGSSDGRSRVFTALAYALLQLPASAATALCARASSSDFIPNGERDGCGVVKGERIGERFATAMMRDGATIGALGGAFACSGSMACSLTARSTAARSLAGTFTVN